MAAEAKESCTWMPFYEEFANCLLPFKEDRQTLIDKLYSVYQNIDMKLPKLDSLERPADIDPYTVFGLFNKRLSETNRKTIISAFAEEFGVEAKQPEDFDGIPVVDNRNATFYAFTSDKRRGDKDIDNLWALFEAELNYADDATEQNRAALIHAFEAAVVQFGIGWKLTMGLFWARPKSCINLDSRNRWYMGDREMAGPTIASAVPKEKDSPLRDGGQYLSICETVRSCLGSDECPFKDFPSLSDAAFVEYERVSKEKKAAAKAAEQEAEENALGDADVETVHYWLYAPGEGACMWDDFYDKGIMALGWHETGDLRAYANKEEIKKALREHRNPDAPFLHPGLMLWQFANEVKPGDVVFAKKGRTGIIGRGVVEGGYEYDELGEHYPHIREVRWTHKGNWTTEDKFTVKTLTDVTDYPDFVAKVSSFFEDDAEEGIESELVAEYPEYSKEQFLAEVFMEQQQYDTLVGVLRAKKNVILQGAPGVGKTFAAKRLAYSMMGVKDADRVMMVQFHQSYSYEDFIEGYRPSADGFDLLKGAFYLFCKKAADDTENDYFFIIDEINRGNLSKIFGELFMLIENDKRGPKNKLQLLYSREYFYVPSNVYLIGMMNTADRSLAMLDYALRRRFAFFDLKPGFATDGFIEYREGLANAKFNELLACVVHLNEAIAADETLGEGFRIGHSYFCGLKSDDVTEAKMSAIVEYELVPMLREYWFDEPGKVREWADALRRSIK